MTRRTFNDFCLALRIEADRMKIRDNNHFIDINRYIKLIIEYLNSEWNFTCDEFKVYSKLLPIIFCLKKLKIELEPLNLTINSLIYYLRQYQDADLTIRPWTNFHITFVSRLLLNIFSANCSMNEK